MKAFFAPNQPARWPTYASKVRRNLVGSTAAAQLNLPQPVFTSPIAVKKMWWHQLLQLGLWSLVAIGTLVLCLVAVPALYYVFNPVQPVAIQPATEGTPLGGAFESGPQLHQPMAYLPPQDDSLPTGQWIAIPRIGVRTELQATAQPEEALATGVWLVPGYGVPGDSDLPMIVAAHRYGWKWWWESDYWKYHSFYLLPELEAGDTVEVIADQRKWVFEIYAGEEGEEITDYQADLILYTCKFLNSPVRHFRYARLIDPTKNTQS